MSFPGRRVRPLRPAWRGEARLSWFRIGIIRTVNLPSYDVVPANEAAWADLAAVFGASGPSARCWCQRYKLAPGEAFVSCPAEDRADRLRDQTGAGHPGSGATSGLVAYTDGEPVGWCAVEPRTAYHGLVRNSSMTAWTGRDEDRTDAGVWAITCVLVRAGHRRRGVSRALVRAAVAYARNAGGRVLEGYPMTSGSALSEELHPGVLSAFLEAGFVEVHRPSARRAVVSIQL
jgi:GNAT superfamily N-acetyltransferase